MKLIHHSILPFLNEGKVDDLKLKYPSFAEDIDFLSQVDTTSTKKVLPWATKILVLGKALKNEIADVITLFLKYENKLSGQEKDINYWKNFTELRDKLFEMNRNPTKSNRSVSNEIKLNGGTKIYEDEQCVLVLVKNKAGACFYGKGTKWCITMSDKNYYEDYTSKNVSFVFLLRKDLDQENPNYKVAFAFHRDAKNNISNKEYFDAEDNVVTAVKFLQDLKNKEKIMSSAEDAAKKQEKSSLAKLLNGEITVDQVPDSDKNEAFYEYILSRDDEFKNVKIPEKFIRSIYKTTEDYSIKKNILSRSETPLDIIQNVVDDNENNDENLAIVSSNPNLTQKMIRQLLDYNNDYIISNLASNPSISDDIINDLLDIDDGATNINLYFNPNVSDEIKNYLFSNSSFRWALAAQDNLTKDLLGKLSNDEEEIVRMNLAKNTTIPFETLEFLSNDSYSGTRIEVVKNKHANENILSKMSNDEDWQIRQAVAFNVNTPIRILYKLSKDSNSNVREYVAWNPNTPNDIMKVLSNDVDEKVANVAKENLK